MSEIQAQPQAPQLVPAGPPPELPRRLFEIPGGVLAAAIAAQLPAAESKHRHLWAAGVCGRIMHLPAGSIATARRHRRSHICVLLEGEMTVWEDGKEERVIVAGTAWVAPAGTEYRGYAHEDVAWLTIFPNQENIKDPDVVLNREEALPEYVLPAGTPIPLLSEIL